MTSAAPAYHQPGESYAGAVLVITYIERLLAAQLAESLLRMQVRLSG